MATYYEMPRPPKRRGDAESYIKELYTYMYQLSERLEFVVNTIAAQQTVQTSTQEGGEQ